VAPEPGDAVSGRSLQAPMRAAERMQNVSIARRGWAWCQSSVSLEEWVLAPIARPKCDPDHDVADGEPGERLRCLSASHSSGSILPPASA
jgi:hypothetical protein